MKNMKKLLALMLALAMVFAMTACGSEPKGSVSPNSDAAPSAAPEATPEPTPEPTSEPEDEIGLGSMNGGTYENSFVGIGCKLDDTWTYLSEEEILEMNGLVADSVDDEELAKQLRDSGSFYDMVAMTDEGTNVNVTIENLGLLYGTVMDTSDYIDAGLKTLESQLGSMGMTVTRCEKVSLDFCGKSTYGIAIAGTMNVQGVDVETYQCLACLKAGTYMCNVTACTYFEDTTADVLDLFYST